MTDVVRCGFYARTHRGPHYSDPTSMAAFVLFRNQRVAEQNARLKWLTGLSVNRDRGVNHFLPNTRPGAALAAIVARLSLFLDLGWSWTSLRQQLDCSLCNRLL
uniref:Uncharacterized protein n=1 Tax=Nelumbo nucifera TaxID=4432 RepID=A0A822ZAH1_NELNU|nr:TPA_asm: hypothetical protein HUJ06_014768 [Nelumbo nucifera]